MNLCDPVEVDLLYHQSVTDVFEGRIPLTKTDTVSHNLFAKHRHVIMFQFIRNSQ